MSRRITKKDCNIQLSFIKEKLLLGRVNLEIKENGFWKNLYQSGECIVSARYWSEMYYQLVALKKGIEIVKDERIFQ